MAVTKHREPNQAKWVGMRPGHNGEQVFEAGAVDNGTTILYTVPAGKVFCWCGWNAVSAGNAYNVKTFLEVYDAVPALSLSVQRFGSAVNSALALSRTYWPPVEIIAGYSIRIRSTLANISLYCGINGWVEDV